MFFIVLRSLTPENTSLIIRQSNLIASSDTYGPESATGHGLANLVDLECNGTSSSVKEQAKIDKSAALSGRMLQLRDESNNIPGGFLTNKEH
jgi:hypothetical protein